jgi:hypothetical protein
MTRLFQVLFFILLTTGCYKTEVIKPTELPKLNYAGVGTVVAGPGKGHLVAVSVGQVEGIDGRMVEVIGEYDATIVAKRGERTTFEHPVRSSIDNQLLRVGGGNRTETAFQLTDVSQVETKTYDGTATLWTILGVSLGVTTIAAIVLYAVLFSQTDSASSSHSALQP